MHHGSMGAQERCQHLQSLHRVNAGRQQVATQRKKRILSVSGCQGNFSVIHMESNRQCCFRQTVQPMLKCCRICQFRSLFKGNALRLGFLPLRDRCSFRGGYCLACGFAGDPLHQTVQPQCLQGRNSSLPIRQGTFLQCPIHRSVPANGGKLSALPCLIGIGDKLLAQLALDFSCMGEDALQRTVLLQQLYRRLIPHPGNAGNVVAGVPCHALPVRYLLRGKAVFLIQGSRCEADGFGNAFPCEHQLRFAVHKLQSIPVACQQKRLHIRLFPHKGQGTQQVIRFPARKGIPLDAHVGQQLADGTQLLNHFRGCRSTARLVVCIGHMAESGGMLVKADCQIVHVFLFDNLQQHIQEAINGIGIGALIIHDRKGMKRPEHQTVAVNNQEYIFHGRNPPILRNKGKAGACTAHSVRLPVCFTA